MFFFFFFCSGGGKYERALFTYTAIILVPVRLDGHDDRVSCL